MDLGIAGKSAIVCGASRGLGRACALALAREGVRVTIVARDQAVLAEAAQQLGKASGNEVVSIAADITTDVGRDAVMAACPAPDILVNNAGGPPPGDFHDWGQKQWFDAINANMYSSIDMIRRCIDGMAQRRFGRIVNITSAAVKSPLPELGLSNGARAGLTGFVAGLARQYAQHNVTINNLLPGVFATERGDAFLTGRAVRNNKTLEAFRLEYCKMVPAGRLGVPEELGATCAFVCSVHGGFIVGQNIVLDGGLFPGTL